MSHLRKYIEQTGVLAPEHLDAALRRQQIYGGSLDTVLLELGVCDARTLGELLTQSCGLEVAPAELLENGLTRPWDRVPSELVDIGWAAPLAIHDHRVVVAVHPDLPNERLGELYRSVDGVLPFVTPECCLEKVASERSKSVVPQRYAVLCAAYVNALRQRPSVSDVGFPILPNVQTRHEDTQTGLPPAPAVQAPPVVVPPPTQEPLEPPPGEAPAPELAPDEDPLDLGPDPERSTNLYGVSVEEKSPAFAPPPLPSKVDAEAESETDAPPPDPRERAIVVPPPPTTGPGAESGDEDPEAAQTLVRAPIVDPDEETAGSGATDATSGDGSPAFVPPADASKLSPETPPPPPVTPPPPAAGPAASPPPPPAAGPAVGAPPPVRFTARGTLIDNRKKESEEFSVPEAERRMAGARARLANAKSRDEVLEAVVLGAMVLSPRVALFRLRDGALHGLPTPQSALPDITDKELPIRRDSDLSAAIATGRWAGTTTDVSLRELLGQREPVPCMFHRVDVAGRPVLIIYLDHDGAEFVPAEANLMQDLASGASAAFEAVLAARRRTPVPTGTVEKPPEDDPRVVPPPAFGTTTPPGWGAAPQPIAREYSSGIITKTRDENAVEPGKSLRRETQVDGSPPSVTAPEEGRPPILTVPAMPPPPPLPPPPPMQERDTQHDTLTGLPNPGAAGLGPRFIPPPLDERENSGIISLAPPIDQPTARGRILLDDEDWDDSPIEETSVAQRRAIDGVLSALARQEADIEDLRALGDAGLRGLASIFPGSLEVLRRDLRALPPPSAHGPHIRAAIRLGSELVPHLLPLFGHADPDVRFYAAFIFQELRAPEVMQPLSTLAFDDSGDVRVISMRVLETYGRHDGFAAAARRVSSELDSNNRTRQLYAARAVGTLRDIASIARLVELLSSKDRFIQEASLESLCSITGQQHGLKPHRWKSWFADEGHRHRIEWIIDSVRHRDIPVRRWAHDELIRVTGHRIPFSPMGDRKSREVAAEAWGEWWTTKGKTRFGVATDDQPTG